MFMHFKVTKLMQILSCRFGGNFIRLSLGQVNT